jgi:hypothetical protein
LLSRSVGLKAAMVMMCETIESMGRKPPEINVTLKDPASNFVIRMYDEIAKWPDKALGEFIKDVTGEVPKPMDTPSMIGTVKKIFHELFLVEAKDTSDVLRYDSRWKMWPHVRRKPLQEGEDEMGKKASKKKVAKKVAKKTSAKKKSGVTESTKIKVVKDSKTPKMPARQKVKKAVPPAGITAGKLMEKTGCTLKTIDAMIGKGFLVAA